MCVGINKYVIIAVSLAAAVKFMPQFGENMLLIVAVACAIMFMSDKMTCKCKTEKMTNPDTTTPWSVGGPHADPNTMIQSGWPVANENVTQEEGAVVDDIDYDPINHLPATIPSSGLPGLPDMSDLKMPGYYLLNNGQFSQDGISGEKAFDMIQKSKSHDLWHQYNHLAKKPHHVYAGKDRVPVLFDRIF